MSAERFCMTCTATSSVAMRTRIQNMADRCARSWVRGRDCRSRLNRSGSATIHSHMRYFLIPTVVSALIMLAILVWLGPVAFVTALLLTVLEVTLSFDNAVVNARVLMRMSEKWQQRFLTWGILIAVFGTRLVLPILIVSASVWTNPWGGAQLAAFNPGEYGHLLEGAQHGIYAFGASFLIMVSLKYFFNEGKEV